MDNSISNWHVLIVEDHYDSAAIVKKTLDYNGAGQVDFVFEGATGLAYLQKERPNLIILDLELPDMYGLDFCKIIKARPEIADIPVIAYTARTFGNQEKVLADAGFAGYILKPFKFDELVPNIKEILCKQASAGG